MNIHRGLMSRLRRSLSLAGLTLLMPVLVLWWAAAHAAAWLVTFTVLPCSLLAQKLYWACPFIPHIWSRLRGPRGRMLRIGFEASYCINFCTRLFTLPMRRTLPEFYIVGFPKCGTTSLAEHLKRHPAISGLAGLPYHETLSKESHFFAGVLGKDAAHSAWLYRTFFPTVMHKWWAEVVRGVDKWMCFDACPVHACMPHVARRMAALTPDAKIVFMLRNPVSGLFSAELPAPPPSDPCFVVPKEVAEMWRQLFALGLQRTCLRAWPEHFYFSLASHMQCGKYIELIQPYLEHFPRENILFINFDDFARDSEAVVRSTLDFVGVDAARFQYQELPVGMKGAYHGRKLHPSVKAYLTSYYAPSVLALYRLLGRDLGWEGWEGQYAAAAAVPGGTGEAGQVAALHVAASCRHGANGGSAGPQGRGAVELIADGRAGAPVDGVVPSGASDAAEDGAGRDVWGSNDGGRRAEGPLGSFGQGGRQRRWSPTCPACQYRQRD